MRGFAICSGCFAAQGRLWLCAACGSCSLWDSVECSARRSTGCRGTRDRGREPTAGEVADRGQSMATANKPPGGGGGGQGGGGGGARVRLVGATGYDVDAQAPVPFEPYTPPF